MGDINVVVAAIVVVSSDKWVGVLLFVWDAVWVVVKIVVNSIILHHIVTIVIIHIKPLPLHHDIAI